MKTISINVMNLCIPCENRCRYCLLSYDGECGGIDYARSQSYAKRFYEWLKQERPELSFLFGWGCSMEHPNLLEAIRFCQSIGSPTGEFLQFNGMKFRSRPELETLLSLLKDAGIRLINMTFYGTEEYHDRFSARKGDYALMLETLEAARKVGMAVEVGIPLSRENVSQMDELLKRIEPMEPGRIFCFVPHSEGRGRLLDGIRLEKTDYKSMSDGAKVLLNRNRFKTEGEWLKCGILKTEKRVLTITLRSDNIDFFENMGFDAAIAYLENLDDAYHSAVPSFEKLAELYGDRNSEKLFSARDLCMHYQKRYIEEKKIAIHDIYDERQCFARRI